MRTPSEFRVRLYQQPFNNESTMGVQVKEPSM